MIEPERPRLLTGDPPWWKRPPVILIAVVVLVLLVWAAYVMVDA